MIVIVLFYKDVEQMEMGVKAEFSLGPFSVVLCTSLNVMAYVVKVCQV